MSMPTPMGPDGAPATVGGGGSAPASVADAASATTPTNTAAAVDPAGAASAGDAGQRRWQEPDDVRATRRRRRRRLTLGSLPVVFLALVLAARLLTLNVVADRTAAFYTAGDRPQMLEWAERQGWVNIAERFRHEFALGDAELLTGRFDRARPHFETALAQVPTGGLDECRVRVNLGLTYERLGDEAKAKERTQEWQQFYARGLEVTRDRPPLCDKPEGEQTGEQLQDTQERLERKNTEGEQGEGEQPQPTPTPTPTPTPSPGSGGTPTPTPTPTPSADPDQTPSEREQDALREQQRRNTIERNQEQQQSEQDGQGLGSPSGPDVPRPW